MSSGSLLADRAPFRAAIEPRACDGADRWSGHRRATSRSWCVIAHAGFVMCAVVAAAASPGQADGLPSAAKNSANSDSSLADRYRGAAKRIIDATLAENDAYRKLEQLCDDIGHRLSGSPQLDKAVQWAADALRKDGQENVRLEPVTVPHWVRGDESLMMIKPRNQPLAMLGLGGSVATPSEGITAPVISVRDEEELDALGGAVEGKVVLFDHPMPPYDPQRGSGYGEAVKYRGGGARMAARYGAVACLVRSATARSLRSPHTGGMGYGNARTKIPAAAVSTEDAAMITRLQGRGIEVVVTLRMDAKTLEPAQSANVIAELRGSTRPEEIVVIGGHLDSWDVGQGAHDDGGGCVTAMEAIHVLRRLNLIPRRTIRVVLWTNEENGLGGARQYVRDHLNELSKHVAAIESDSGSFRPIGYSVDCSDEQRQRIAAEQMRDILSVLAPLGATDVTTGYSGADVSPMRPAGVVLLGHRVEGSKYFDYHHTHADTLDKVDPEELSQNVAVLATVAYILADMPGRLGQ